MSNGLNGSTPRRRRSASEARDAILEAAEGILIERGPVELKIQQIAGAAGISVSTTHHHFGGISEIQAALAKRMIARLVSELSDILEDGGLTDDTAARQAIQKAYSIVASPRHARLIAWLFLTSDAAKLLDLATPLDAIHRMVTDRLVADGVQELAEARASSVILRFASHAIGEALVDSVISPLLPDAHKAEDEASEIARIIGVEID